jgi:hypothetical protein
MANPEHLARLRDGVEAWNKFLVDRSVQFLKETLVSGDGKPGSPTIVFNLNLADSEWFDRMADLSGADLRGKSLKNVHLKRVDLSGADLRGADLTSADLEAARLSRADLREAMLVDAMLHEADLTSAKLQGVVPVRREADRRRSSGVEPPRGSDGRDNIGAQ